MLLSHIRWHMDELNTKKIYYKKFDHRLVIDTEQGTGKQHDPKCPTNQVIEWLLHNYANDMAWRGLPTVQNIYERGRNYHVKSYTVFFNNKDLFTLLEKHLGKQYLREYERPIDDFHSEMLKGNDKLVTRPKLFFDRYRFVIRVPAKQVSYWSVDTKEIKEMRAWCKSQFGDPRKAESCYKVSGERHGAFYFENAKDVVMFKMTWAGSKMTTERVMLHSEVEELSKAQQA